MTGYQADVGHLTNKQVGILGINTNDALTQGLAGSAVGGPVGGVSMGDPSGQGLPRLNYDTQFEFVNNWNHLHGNHQLRLGIDVIRERLNCLTVTESSRGNVQFHQLVTAEAGVPGTGLGMGTFLLGTPSEVDRAVFSQLPAERDTRGSPYIQDVWHVNQNLTVNLGLRYDYIGPSTPAFAGGGVKFNPSTGHLLLSGIAVQISGLTERERGSRRSLRG